MEFAESAAPGALRNGQDVVMRGLLTRLFKENRDVFGNRLPEDCVEQMLRPDIFLRLRGWVFQERGTDKELIFRRYKDVEGVAVAHHVEDIRAHDRRPGRSRGCWKASARG